jgi:predicted nucleotide-binding protein
MSNEKIIDRARILFVSKCRDRDDQLERDIQNTFNNLNSRNVLHSSIASNDISRVLSNEFKIRADISWQSISRSIEIGDIEDLEALNSDLKEEIKHELNQERQRLVDLVQSRLRNMNLIEYLKGIENSLLQIQNLTISKHNAEINLHIDKQRKLSNTTSSNKTNKKETMPDNRKIFVVHGRDAHLRKEFFGFLRALNLQPLEWSDAIRLTGKTSPYIGEILDRAFNEAQAVVVLLTPDDEVRLMRDLWGTEEDSNEMEFRLQARPNVLFEAGMAFGRDPNRTLLIEVGKVKAFSDIAGRHVIKLTNDTEKRKDVADRLRTAGCSVSTVGYDWLYEGDFTVERGSSKFIQTESQHESNVKWVDLQYPKDTGLESELENQGYKIKWCSEKRLARCLDIEGWALVTQTTQTGEKKALKVKDRPYNQTLIMKRDGENK